MIHVDREGQSESYTLWKQRAILFPETFISDSGLSASHTPGLCCPQSFLKLTFQGRCHLLQGLGRKFGKYSKPSNNSVIQCSFFHSLCTGSLSPRSELALGRWGVQSHTQTFGDLSGCWSPCQWWEGSFYCLLAATLLSDVSQAWNFIKVFLKSCALLVWMITKFFEQKQLSCLNLTTQFHFFQLRKHCENFSSNLAESAKNRERLGNCSKKFLSYLLHQKVSQTGFSYE
jgi:hypothetical protein